MGYQIAALKMESVTFSKETFEAIRKIADKNRYPRIIQLLNGAKKDKIECSEDLAWDLMSLGYAEYLDAQIKKEEVDSLKMELSSTITPVFPKARFPETQSFVWNQKRHPGKPENDVYLPLDHQKELIKLANKEGIKEIEKIFPSPPREDFQLTFEQAQSIIYFVEALNVKSELRFPNWDEEKPGYDQSHEDEVMGTQDFLYNKIADAIYAAFAGNEFQR